MNKRSTITLIIFFLLYIFSVGNICAQNYHAINGSSYAGSLGIDNNPASMVNTPYKWDVNLLSLQLKNNTNAFLMNNFSLLSPSSNATVSFIPGNFKRYEYLNSNGHLLNVRYAINRRSSIAVGFSMKAYTNVKLDPFNYIDSFKTANDFLAANATNTSFSGRAKGAGWAEMFFSYAQTIIDNERVRINMGATIKGARGMAGLNVNAFTAGVQTSTDTGGYVYSLNKTNVSFGYSSSIDRWKNTNTTKQNIRNLFEGGYGGATIEGGIECLIKTQAVTDFYDDEDYYDYDWKFGLSFLDFGLNQFIYGAQSRYAGLNSGSVTGTELDAKFTGIGSVKEFNDSLATLADSYGGLGGNFKIINPARMVVNVDHYINKNFFVNAELSLNLSPIAGNKRLFVRETNLITVTPRWETIRWGAYMPMQLSTEGKFMLGGAIKAGPLLVGFHNLANIFSKNKMQNGGGYIALVIHPAQYQTAKANKSLSCPTRN